MNHVNEELAKAQETSKKLNE